MKGPRGTFSSRLGFILAATGSAVGLGNIWGFPTNTAGNGGAAFVLMYLILAFCLAYPALMAELIIGRHTRANICTALQQIATGPGTRRVGTLVGGYGVMVAALILSFYSLIAGWMVAHFAGYAAALAGLDAASRWLATDSIARNILASGVFSVLTILVVSRGVSAGIERWSSRLMPALIVLLLALITYVLTRPGAREGLTHYLVPDFSRILEPGLILSALGQAFFSLSLGVGTMLIYGSYIRQQDNLPAIGAAVTLVDIAIAFLAGLLIVPAMFAAHHLGIPIYQQGQLIAGPDLIFNILPALFNSMGAIGELVALGFFALMTIAALTSSISMLEGPVALAVETSPLERPLAAWLIGTGVFIFTVMTIFYFEPLFTLIVTVTTEYSQPLLGIALCLFAGWVMSRQALLEEIRSGLPNAEQTLFWKLWPFYVRVVCPLLIATAFIQSLR